MFGRGKVGGEYETMESACMHSFTAVCRYQADVRRHKQQELSLCADFPVLPLLKVIIKVDFNALLY